VLAEMARAAVATPELLALPSTTPLSRGMVRFWPSTTSCSVFGPSIERPCASTEMVGPCWNCPFEQLKAT
jgi:hypothetical protein